jgi:hypothetical protein
MASLIDGPSNRDALHALNGQLIRHLRDTFTDCPWKEWIVNVIVLHRTVGVVETATLETSATLWYGEEFFSDKDCREKPGRVRSLDGRVPLHGSFAGWSIRSGYFVWVDNLPELQEDDSDKEEKNPLKDVYRSFGYVGVEASALPHAEYVFPIRLRAGLTDIVWGVLNCEWYKPKGHSEQASPFENYGRDYVVKKVNELLELHGRYLPVVLYQDGLKPKCSERLSQCYDEMFKSHQERTRGSNNESYEYS